MESLACALAGWWFGRRIFRTYSRQWNRDIISKIGRKPFEHGSSRELLKGLARFPLEFLLEIATAALSEMRWDSGKLSKGKSFSSFLWQDHISINDLPRECVPVPDLRIGFLIRSVYSPFNDISFPSIVTVLVQ